MRLRHSRYWFCFLAAVCGLAVPARSADWPERPVKIVIPFGAAGSSDRFGRLVAQHLSIAFAQQFYVENKPGGSGALGSQQVARAEPDGYTLLIAGTGPHVTAPAINPAIGYDPMRDFTHIAMIGGDSYLFAAHSALGVKSLADLASRMSATRETISSGSPGPGTIGHLIIEQLRLKPGLKNLNHVPYRGGGPLASDFLGNHVSTAAIATVSAIEHAKAGTIVPLAVAADERLPTLPDAPTLTELGHPDVGGSTWIWLAGPANLPVAIRGKLNEEVRKFLRTADVQQHFRREALLSKDLDVPQLNRFLDDETRRWRAVVQSAGLQKAQ
jgi:tripartite-type tricarboxylate transporter receptor subunit TctC